MAGRAALVIAIVLAAGCVAPAPPLPTIEPDVSPELVPIPAFSVPVLGDESWADYGVTWRGETIGAVRISVHAKTVVDGFGQVHEGYVHTIEALSGTLRNVGNLPYEPAKGDVRQVGFTRCGQPLWSAEPWGQGNLRTNYIFPGDEDLPPAPLSSSWRAYPPFALSGAQIPGAPAGEPRDGWLHATTIQDWGFLRHSAVHVGNGTIYWQEGNGTRDERWIATYDGSPFPLEIAEAQQYTALVRGQWTVAGKPLPACQDVPLRDAFADDAVPIGRLGPAEDPPFRLSLRGAVDAIAAGETAPKVKAFLDMHPEAFLYSWEGLDDVAAGLSVPAAWPQWRLQFGAPGLDQVAVAFCNERLAAPGLLGGYDCGDGSVSDVDHRYGGPPPRVEPDWANFTTMPSREQRELFERFEGDLCYVSGYVFSYLYERPHYHLRASHCGAYLGPELDASNGFLIDGPRTV